MPTTSAFVCGRSLRSSVPPFPIDVRADRGTEHGEQPLNVFVETESLLGWPSGIGAYVLGLCSGLAELEDPSLELHTGYATCRPGRHRALRGRQREMGLRIPYHTVPLPGRLAARLGPLRRFAAWPPQPRYDIVHATSMVMPEYIPGAARLLTIYDVGFLRFPERRFGATGGDRMPERVAREIRRADGILAISAFTKREIREVCGIPEERIFVTYLATQWTSQPDSGGASRREVLERHGLAEGGYLLSVGLISPRKNYETLLDAFARFREHRPEAVLVIVGGVGWDADPVLERIEASGTAVRWLERVGGDELRALYGGARAYVSLSWYEGFGIPVLEAMQSGCPVCAATGSAMAEVVGDAGVTVAPDDEDEACRLLGMLWDDDDLRARLIRQGLRRGAEFSWKRTAEQTMEVYRHFAGT